MASTISHCRLIVAKPGYSTRRAHERAERIARARRNLMSHAHHAAERVPTLRPRSDRVRVAFGTALSLAIVGHVGVVFAAFYTSATETIVPREPVKVRVVMNPLPPEPEAEPEAKVVAKETPELPRPTPKLRPRAEERKPKSEPLPEAPTDAPEPIAIVGLTLESTSNTGSGPAFAVGQTLAGTTDRIAATARTGDRDAPVGRGEPTLPSSRNRRAAPRAAAGVRVQPAQRLARVEPEYPPLLERQRIEADVTVRVHITASGQLAQVELVRGADQAAFNEAALAAARKERFSPETHDEKPVETSLTYTYRFRVTP